MKVVLSGVIDKKSFFFYEVLSVELHFTFVRLAQLWVRTIMKKNKTMERGPAPFLITTDRWQAMTGMMSSPWCLSGKSQQEFMPLTLIWHSEPINGLHYCVVWSWDKGETRHPAKKTLHEHGSLVGMGRWGNLCWMTLWSHGIFKLGPGVLQQC